VFDARDCVRSGFEAEARRGQGRTKMRNDQADPMQNAVVRVRLSQKAEYCMRSSFLL
jgi:hypothetical protein